MGPSGHSARYGPASSEHQGIRPPEVTPTHSPRGEFPYTRLLAYRRGEVANPEELARIEQCLMNPGYREYRRWRAHWESVRFLDLERAATLQDAEDLKGFSAAQASAPCWAVVETQGQVFVDLIEGKPQAGGQTRQQWSEHLERCVYCRRMRRRMNAERERARAGLPPTEPLLRDWLLGPYYQDILERITRKLTSFLVAGKRPVAGLPAQVPLPTAALDTTPPGELTDSLRRDPNIFLEKMEPIAPLMLERIEIPREHAPRFLVYLRQAPVMKQLANARHVRDVLGVILAGFCQESGLHTSEDPQSYLTRNVIDNLLWQAAVLVLQKKSAANERSPLKAVELALHDQLMNREEPELPNTTVTTTLKVCCRDTQLCDRLFRSLSREYETIAG